MKVFFTFKHQYLHACSLDAPLENGNISNSVTKPKSIDEMFANQKDPNATLKDLEDVLRSN